MSAGVVLVVLGCVWTECFASIGVSIARVAILEIRGFGIGLWFGVGVVGLAPCWGSEAIRLGAWFCRFGLCGRVGGAGVLFEICIVCVSVLSVYLIDRCLVKLCRAHGGCLGAG